MRSSSSEKGREAKDEVETNIDDRVMHVAKQNKKPQSASDFKQKASRLDLAFPRSSGTIGECKKY
jgi:hypothetical protein